MKRITVVLLALALALGVSACAKKDAPPVADDVWDYETTTETAASEEYRADDGTLLATWSHEQPALSLTGAEGTPPEALRAVCEAFNDGMSERAAASRAAFEELKAAALEYYGELKADGNAGFFTPYEQSETVASVYRDGGLLSVTLASYGYWGGVHGGSAAEYVNFDLGAGAFFTLDDLTDDPAALRAAVVEEILAQIDAQGVEEGGYFPEYETTIREKETFNAGFGAEGMTVVFDQYELAPYAAGMPEFEIAYDVLSPYLNDYGAALLGR